MQKSKDNTRMPVFRSPLSPGFWTVAAKEVTNLRTLVFAALIVAIRVALKNVKIPLGDNLHMFVGFPIAALGGSVYGPVMALIVGAVTDLLGVVFAPFGTAFHPAWTLMEMFTTFLYALFTYRQKITFGRLFLTKFSVNFLGNIIGESWLMTMLYGKGIFYYVATCALKNVVMLPIEVLILAGVFGALMTPLIRLRVYEPSQNKLVVNSTRVIVLVVITSLILIPTVYVLFNYDACYEAVKAFFRGI